MFIITNKQIEVLSSYMLGSFIKKAQNHLKQKFPVSTKQMTDTMLHGLITEGIEKAARYEIVEKDDVMHFIEYIICLGKDFDIEYSWARKILRTKNIEGSEKVANLNDTNPLYAEFYYD